jgi:hypothetical protein
MTTVLEHDFVAADSPDRERRSPRSPQHDGRIVLQINAIAHIDKF